MSWDIKTDRPIYIQLMEQIQLKICGIYPPGSRLPSVRDLAQEASVNPNTMQRALAELEAAGLLYTNRTSGRFVTEDTEMIVHVKNKLAEKHVKDFLKKMTELGFNSDEVMSIISDIVETEEMKYE